jgi:flagellar FliL protein
MAQIAAILFVTLMAIAVGGLQGRQTFALVSASLEQDRKDKDAQPAPTIVAATNVRELKPIITNLLAPPGVWVRLEGAIVCDGSGPEIDRLAGDIAADTLAYLRTLSLSQIEGADGTCARTLTNARRSGPARA